MGYLMGYPSCVKTHMAGKSPNPMAFETKWTNHGTPGGFSSKSSLIMSGHDHPISRRKTMFPSLESLFCDSNANG